MKFRYENCNIVAAKERVSVELAATLLLSSDFGASSNLIAGLLEVYLQK